MARNPTKEALVFRQPLEMPYASMWLTTALYVSGAHNECLAPFELRIAQRELLLQMDRSAGASCRSRVTTTSDDDT